MFTGTFAVIRIGRVPDMPGNGSIAGGTCASEAYPFVKTTLIVPVPEVPKLFKWFIKLVNDAKEPTVGLAFVGNTSVPLILYVTPPTNGDSALLKF
jgi:hypothetical protein